MGSARWCRHPAPFLCAMAASSARDAPEPAASASRGAPQPASEACELTVGSFGETAQATVGTLPRHGSRWRTLAHRLLARVVPLRRMRLARLRRRDLRNSHPYTPCGAKVLNKTAQKVVQLVLSTVLEATNSCLGTGSNWVPK